MGRSKDKRMQQTLSSSKSKLEKLQSSILYQYKNAIKPEEVEVLLDNVEAIKDADRLAKYIMEKPQYIKEKIEKCPYNTDINIIDLKLQARGPKEDDLYGIETDILKNIRRGNTLLEIQDSDRKLRNLIGRKGLVKFFDLKYEFIDQATRYDDNKLSGVLQQNIKNYQLAGPLKEMLDGHAVEVIKTLKANGENAQIAYNPELKAWVISSKNVGLLCRNRQDLELYKQSERSFAYEIGQVWFDKLEELKEKGLVEGLKQDMANRTFVGEYIGSPEHQHMVKYNRITIIFYAIVDNYSADICWPSEKALEVMKKYELDVVNVQSAGLYNDFESLCNGLCQLFKDVAKSKIVEEEEGSVLYLTKRDKSGDSSKDRVLSLAKLKTIEYRIFRKMREKLRNYFCSKRTGNQPDKVISSFNREMNKIIQDNELPKPLEFYTGLLKSAFEYIKLNVDNIEVLKTEYVTFQERLLKFHFKKQQIEGDNNLFESQVLDMQTEIKYEKPQEITKLITKQNTTANTDPKTKITSKVLYELKIILFCPPGVISEEGLQEIQKDFEYSSIKILTKQHIQNLQPSYNPHILQVYTLDDKYLKEQLPNNENTYYIIYGFTDDRTSLIVDAIQKNKIEGFDRMKGATLNKFFNEQPDKVKELAFKFDMEKYNYIDLNRKEVGASLEPKLINQLQVLKNEAKTIKIQEESKVEEEEIKESFKEKFEEEKKQQQQKQEQVLPIEMTFGQQEKEEMKESSSFVTALQGTQKWDDQTIYGTAEDCYQALKKFENIKKLVLVIIPFGVVGSGKSTFLKSLREIADTLGWSVSSESSDETRYECMQQLMKSNGYSKKDAFDKSGAMAGKAFNQKLEKMICNSHQSTAPVHIIFIDKNHPINGLPNTIKLINEKSPNKVTIRKLYLIPNISKPMQRYPFSASFFLQCYQRLQNRDNHETLDNSDPILSTKILCMFFKMYHGEVLDKNFLSRHGLDGFFQAPLTVDDQKIEVPKELESEVIDLLSGIKKGSMPQDDEKIKEFMEYAKSLKDLYKEQKFDKSELEFAILDQLLLATELKKPNQRSGVQTRSMAKKLQEEEDIPKGNTNEWNVTTTKGKKGNTKQWKKPPLYVGIDCMEDKKFNHKIKELFNEAFQLLHSKYPKGGFDDLMTASKDLIKSGGKIDGWQARPSYHVTALFIGSNEAQLQHPIIQNFEEDQKVQIEIKAVIFIPKKIMTAICFPKYDIDNKFPHMTLLLNKWKAKDSNTALEHTCDKGQPFYQLYEKARKGQGTGETAFEPQIQFKGEQNPAYFAILERSIAFDGITKAFNQQRLLYKTESIIEDTKWDAPISVEAKKGINHSRISSNGGFFYGKQISSKEGDIEFTATIEICENTVTIKLDDTHNNGSNLRGREIRKLYNLRDILSAQIDPNDDKILTLWIFRQHAQKKGCCKRTEIRPRRLESFQLIGQDKFITEEWAAILQCAIDGVSYENQMPRKRKLLILVNPFSGRRLAARNWEVAKPILEKAHIDMKVIMTERAGHAYDIVNQEIKIGDYDGIATVSGDGLIHEVVNGLYRRADWFQLMSTVTLGFIPGGSANGLVKAVLDYAGEDFSVENAAFVIAKGRQTKMDLTEIEGEYQKEKIYSFLSTFWGIIADCDINSEVIRCIGSARFTIWGVYRVICQRRYTGSLFFTGKKLYNKKELPQFNENYFSSDLPEIQEEAVRHEEDDDQYKDIQFNSVLIQNTPFIGSSIHSGPMASINDGYNDIIVQSSNKGKCRLANLLIQQDDGTYFNERGDLKPSLGIDYLKCKVWRLDPLVKSPKPDSLNPEKRDIETGHTSADILNVNQESKTKYLLDEDRESGGRKNSNVNQQFSVALQQQLLETKKKNEKVYIYDQRAFYSIDGEKYPAQKLQGRVLKTALPIYY